MPWNEPANISVAPNSPSARPERQRRAGRQARQGGRGSSRAQKPRASEAPSVREASISVRSTAANAAIAWRM